MPETGSQLCKPCRTKNLSPDIVRHKHTSGACGTPDKPIVIQYVINLGELEASALQGCPFCKGIISGLLGWDILKTLKDLRDNDGCTSQSLVEVSCWAFLFIFRSVSFHYL